jgi:hypothetical protein
MRRQSSQVSGTQVPFDVDDSVLDATSPSAEPLSPSTTPSVYGDSADDAGDEVRFSVEVTRIDKLENVYSLDIRRLKGNLRSYKFLYDMLREWVQDFDLFSGYPIDFFIDVLLLPLVNKSLCVLLASDFCRILPRNAFSMPLCPLSFFF